MTLSHLKVANEFFLNEFIRQMVWIKLFIFYYLRNKQSRILFIYENKYKRSDPWMLPLKSVWENVLPGSCSFLQAISSFWRECQPPRPQMMQYILKNALKWNGLISLDRREVLWYCIKCRRQWSVLFVVSELVPVVFWEWQQGPLN